MTMTSENPQSIDALLKQFKDASGRVCSEQERLANCQAFVSSLLDVIPAGIGTTPDNVKEVVRLLLRAVLDEKHANSSNKLTKILGEENVKKHLIKRLVQGEPDGLDILNGMIDAVKEKGVAHREFVRLGTNIVNVWFEDKTGRVLETRAGFVAALFRFVHECADRQQECCGERNASMEKLDDYLHPIVAAAIAKEEAWSINLRVGALTVIEHAAAKSRLPKVTQAIVQHPGIRLDSRNDNGWMPLAVVLSPSSILDDSHLAVITVLLQHPSVDVSIGDVTGRTCMDFCIDHLSDGESKPVETLKIIKKLAHHHTVTERMVRDGFCQLLGKRATQSEISRRYVDALRAFVDHSRFSAENRDADGRNAMEVCLRKLTKADSMTTDLQCVGLVCEHPTTTSEMLNAAFGEVLEVKCDEIEAGTEKTRVLKAIAGNKAFDVNSSLVDGATAGHLAAKENIPGVMEVIARRSDYHPNVRDAVGHTSLYYICQYFPPHVAVNYLKDMDIQWDYSSVNMVGQNVCEFYQDLHTRDPVVQKLLGGKTGTPLRRAVNTEFASNTRLPVELNERPIEWKINETVQQAVGVKVNNSTQELYTSKHHLAEAHKMYHMHKARKGRACVISLPKFEVNWLPTLDGYIEDFLKLRECLSQIGFDVMYPHYDGTYYLTAKELEMAVREFAESLQQDDQCAILCLLTHGKENFIYGSDGNTIPLQRLLSLLDNVHCIEMANKPKVVILQSCQGDAEDHGTFVPASPTDADTLALGDIHLPAISDMIVCSPALPGYQSFVKAKHDRGSVFIKVLVDVVAKFAHVKDLNSMLTIINRQISREIIRVYDSVGREVIQKQMSHFDSCLRRRLFLFPCPGGRGGADWRTDDTSHEIVPIPEVGEEPISLIDQLLA